QPVDLVLERLPASRDRDLPAGLLDQGARDILLPLEGDEGARVVEPDEDVEDVLHRLQVVRSTRDVPPPQRLEREPPELADRVPEAEEVRGVRGPAVPRAGQ